VAVEGYDRRDFRGDRDEDLVDRPDRHLGDEPGIPLLDLFSGRVRASISSRVATYL
jgi:hypothetical protein